MSGIAFLILGVVFLIISLYTFIIAIPKSRKQAERRTGKTTGKISAVHEKVYKRKKSGKVGYYESKMYKIDISYQVNGQNYEIKDIASTTSRNEGEPVTVSYDPENPADAHADEFFAGVVGNKIGGVIMLIVAVVLLLIGVAIQML